MSGSVPIRSPGPVTHAIIVLFVLLIGISVSNGLRTGIRGKPVRNFKNLRFQNISKANWDAYPTCIIGAGLSGLNLGSLLQAKGHSIHIFEKEALVGGKVRTFRQGQDLQVEMCPLLFTRDSQLLLDRIKEHELHAVPIPNERDQVMFDPNSGVIDPPGGNLTSEQQIALGAALKEAGTRYIQHRNVYKEQLKFGYFDASPDLFVPMSEWLESRDLALLKPILAVLITVEGYGALEDVPALYVLKLVDDNIMTGFTSNEPVFLTLQEGLDVLVNRMAKSLPISLRQEAMRIERQNRQKIIHFRSGGVAFCKNVILAFPPLLPKLEALILDLNAKEWTVLNQIKVHHYMSAAAFIPAMNRTLYSSNRLDGKGEVVGFVKQSSLRRQNIFSSYSWIRGAFSNSATVPEVGSMTEQLKGTLSKISAGSDFQIFDVLSSEFFPHVGPSAMKAGFFKDMDSIQGNGGIYYATPALLFETMNYAMEMTEGFVERYAKNFQ